MLNNVGVTIFTIFGNKERRLEQGASATQFRHVVASLRNSCAAGTALPLVPAYNCALPEQRSRSAKRRQTLWWATFTADDGFSGTGTVTVTAASYTNAAGNTGASGSDTVAIDTLNPTVTVTGPVSPTGSDPFNVTIAFSEVVAGFVVGDITVGNGSVTNLTDNGGGNFTATIDSTSDGNVTVDVNGGVASDLAGNANTPATQFSVTVVVETAPRVLDVIVASSGWNAPFVDAVDGDGLGAGNGLGFSLVGSDQLQTLPWIGIDTVYLVFSENVSASLADGDVVISGTNGGTYTLGTLQYGVAGLNIVTVPMTGEIDIDSLVVSILDGAVQDQSGNGLDGEWTSGQSAPSGDSVVGGQFDFFFNVLPGDENASGQVTVFDALTIFAFNTFATTEALARQDIDGSGQITTTDALLAFSNNTFGLPAPPTPPATVVLTIASSSSQSLASYEYTPVLPAAPTPPATVAATIATSSSKDLATYDTLFGAMSVEEKSLRRTAYKSRQESVFQAKSQSAAVASLDLDWLPAENKEPVDSVANVDEVMTQFSEESQGELSGTIASRSLFAPQLRPRYLSKGKK